MFRFVYLVWLYLYFSEEFVLSRTFSDCSVSLLLQAFHFYILAQKQLYEGRPEAALRTVMTNDKMIL